MRHTWGMDAEVGDLESSTSSSNVYDLVVGTADLVEGSHVISGGHDTIKDIDNNEMMSDTGTEQKKEHGRWGLMMMTIGMLILVCITYMGSLIVDVPDIRASLDMEVVYADGSGYNIDPAPHATLDADMKNHDDIAFCESAFVYGVTSRRPSRGCVAVAHEDLFSDVVESKIVPYGHYCIGSKSLKELRVNFDMIKAATIFEDPEKGFHTISQFAPGEDVEVVIFSGKNFDGQSATVYSVEDGRLATKFYPDGTSADDNVQSFIIKSSADHYFAGKDCGLKTKVCPVIIKKEDAIAEQPEGCALFTTRDVSDESLNNKALTKGVRVCVNSEAEEVKVNRDALEAMKMIYDDGNRKSKISYINEGADVNLKYYDSLNPSAGDYNMSPGGQIYNKFPDGRSANNNIYSFKISAPHTSSVPLSC